MVQLSITLYRFHMVVSHGAMQFYVHEKAELVNHNHHDDGSSDWQHDALHSWAIQGSEPFCMMSSHAIEIRLSCGL